MPADRLVANRFEIEREAGAGGMSRVYAARDRLDGARVALKLLQRRGQGDLDRFSQEARLLSTLRHPAIVGYVAHGTTASGDPYIAMQWLEGRDLASHLSEGGLSLRDALGVACRIAGALGAAHAHGIVHRDVKPSNVFLVDDHVERATLIDFGIARPEGGSQGATGTGATVGTPGYMSPEQARGEHLDARADVYSLGCVLFECLTGRPVFQGEHAIALLAKILLATAPRVGSIVPVPEELDQLVAQMLAKEPGERPADGRAVVRAIEAIARLPTSRDETAPETKRRRGLTNSEQRLVCVVLATPSQAGIVSGDTLTPEQLQAAPAAAREAVMRCGSNLHVLADGSMVVTPAPAGSAADQAWQAARTALALRHALPGASISITTSRGTTSAELPALEVIDRAAHRLLSGRPKPGVHVDEATMGLLGDRFEVEDGDEGIALVGERSRDDRAPTLLGKPTLCVGRERELSMLLGLYEQCEDESVSRAAVVVGAAGLGKTRVRRELLRRLAQRGAPEAWIAYGDPMSAGSPFGMVGQALRRAAGIAGGEPLAERRAKLATRVAAHVASRERARVAQFLGELIGSPFDDAESEPLRAARHDAMLMSEQIARAFVDFMQCECRAHPVVIVFEDLQWGDGPTVQLIDAALGRVADGRLFVLALARPEVRSLFPNLWTQRGVLELSLAELTRAASEKLVRGALGKGMDGAELSRIVERAGGNAFYLEELVRAVTEGGGDVLPDTVLAMAESRLQRLDPEARRVLRAASILGAVFWRGGLIALLGGEGSTYLVDQSLDVLVRSEVVLRRVETKLEGEPEYVFRHALLRDAAYAMLTEEDKKLGHQLAGEWLEAHFDAEPLVLAEHFERGARPARAAALYRKAAGNALEANDLEGVVSAGKRALACGAAGHDRGAVLGAQAEACLRMGDNAEALRSALAAADSCTRYTDDWYAALGIAVQASSNLGQTASMQAVVDLLQQDTKGRVTVEQAAACGFAGLAYNRLGQYPRCAEILRWIEARADASVLADPTVAIGLGTARASLALSLCELDDYKREREHLAAVAARIGNPSAAVQNRAGVAYACLLAGRYDEAEQRFRDCLEDARKLGLKSMAAMAKQNLGLALEREGRLGEAEVFTREALEEFQAQHNPRMQSASQCYLATILLRTGALEAAEQEARLAVDSCTALPPSHAEALGTLARVLLERGDRDVEALSVARRGMAILETIGSLDEGEPLLRLVHARALYANREAAEALAAVAASCNILRARAAKITDTSWRESYLGRIPENRQTFELEAKWRSEVPA